MAYVIADNIISPLGETSEENYRAVKAGKSGILNYPPGSHGIPDGFTASLMSADFETVVLRSVGKALEMAHLDPAKGRVAFILSSTKGDVEKLSPEGETTTGQAKTGATQVSLGGTARRIAAQLGFNTKPFVVCNACISGLSALILADRLLETGRYDHAVVCGCDTPGRFIISGFQSLKALSAYPCRPFDMERLGLNLGEAAATMVLARELPRAEESPSAVWQIGRGFVRNDAFHISAPSKTAEGLCKALTETLRGVDADASLAFVNAHGTATLFNDQMESVAIRRMALSDVPLNALKGYFGHTLGAAGVLETILSMKAVDDHIIIGTRGFQELGVSGKVNVSAQHRLTDKHSFVKMLSGFGGCNATILAEKVKTSLEEEKPVLESAKSGLAFEKTHEVVLVPGKATVDGNPICMDSEDVGAWFTSLYKQKIGDYPKYYKMDSLCRLGFVASELLLQAEGKERFRECDDRAVVLFNHSSSIASDRKYVETIGDGEDYYPSPSVFVYTLPNIVTGEIAIRNHYHGETSFYILPGRDERQMEEVWEATFLDPQIKSILTGWIDYEDGKHFEARLMVVKGIKVKR